MSLARPRAAPASPESADERATKQPERWLGRAPRGGLEPRDGRARSLGPVPERRAPLLAGVPLGFRIADAYLAIAAALLLEVAAVAVARRRELAGTFEFARALTALYPIALVAAAPGALVAGVAIELARAAGRERRAPRAGLAALAGAFAAIVGVGVTTGRHFEDPARRALFVGALALAAAGTAWGTGPAAARGLARLTSRGARRDRRVLAAAAVFGAIFAALELANALVLPRLYPAMHAGLGALALVAAGFAAVPWLEAGPARATTWLVSPPVARAALALATVATCAAMTPSAARAIAPSDNVRLIYATHAPLVSHAVTLAANIAKPPPLEEQDLPEAATAAARALDFEGRDVVLITVDALRADHVGAYGYARATTPNLDALAADGAVFEHAYTATPHTSYALTSMLTGKYMRPLLLQDLGADSETLALHLRRYGYKTAAFYPPAIFFIDGDRFAPFRDRGLDFEYARVEFMSAKGRVPQVRAYLDTLKPDDKALLWVHLFEPHEPYVRHDGRDFGDRDVDRYDAEIAEADAAIGDLVRAVRATRPNAVVIVTADHGEEFLDHGGRYHGTTVYEEQVRVPLVVSAPGRVAPRRIGAPVQLVDVLPTLLSALGVPRPARVRGRDLGPLMAASPTPDAGQGFAFAETDAQTMLAKATMRLVCERRIGACALYDVERDPAQRFDLSETRKAELGAMRTELRGLEASHGRFELRGLRAEGKAWPEALRRGIAGDGDAAVDVAALLDDADVAIRRKSGEVLFDLRRPESAPFLRLAVVRDEDDEVRTWCALTLTRLGEGAARARELARGGPLKFRRLAALALAETGDDRGDDTLVAWLRANYARDVKRDAREAIEFRRSVELIEALGKIKAKAAVMPMLDAFEDVRLRPHLARALAAIGEDAARGTLAARLATEPNETTRVAIAEALVKLGAGPELQVPLVRLLGAPDPLPNGLAIALSADLLQYVGGPRKTDLGRLRRFATSGVSVPMVVPKPPKGEPNLGVRVLCRARSTDDLPGEIRVGRRTKASAMRVKRDSSSFVPSRSPELDPARSLGIPVPASKTARELFADLPMSLEVEPGDFVEPVFYATQNVSIEACALVPKTREPPPPPPKPWSPESPDAPGEAPSEPK